MPMHVVVQIISKKASRKVTEIFSVLVDDIKSLNMERINYKIDYKWLKEGAITETRFVLGKIIMNTMRDGITHHRTKLLSEKDVFHASEPKIEQVEHGKLNSKDVEKVAQNHKEMSNILEKVPTMEKQHQTRAPKEMPTILEKVSTLKKQRQTHTPNQMLHILKNAPKLEKWHDAQAPEKTLRRKPKASTKMLNVLKLSNHFKGDEDLSKKFNKPEKQPTVQVRDLDASRKTKATRKLSVLFK